MPQKLEKFQHQRVLFFTKRLLLKHLVAHQYIISRYWVYPHAYTQTDKHTYTSYIRHTHKCWHLNIIKCV